MKRIVSFFILLSVSLALFSQTYVSSKLQDIATQIDSRSDFNHPLNIIKSKAGKVTHIGFSLFSEATKADYPSPVYNFVERYLLELYLMDDATLITRMLAEDKVQIQGKGSLREKIALLLAANKDNLSVSIAQDDKNYAISVAEGQRSMLSMTFPVQYELLLGGNKKEIESTLYEDLLFYKEPILETNTLLTAEQGKLLVDMGNNVFRQVGMTYIIDSMNSDCYYQRLANGNYEPIYDSRHPEQSIRNLVLLSNKLNINAALTQMLYGYKKTTFDVTLNKFLSYCRNKGCTTYVGIEELTDKKISGTIILHNEAYGYCHQCYFSMSPQMLSNSGEGNMLLTLYAYVPTHNIQTLFQEHLNSKVK